MVFAIPMKKQTTQAPIPPASENFGMPEQGAVPANYLPSAAPKPSIGATLQDPALQAALLQFGINMMAGQGPAQSLGAAGAAAGRVGLMQQADARRAMLDQYAAQDQQMQTGRYNMDQTAKEQEAEYRRQQLEFEKQKVGIADRNEKRLESQGAGKGGISETTKFSWQKRDKATRDAFLYSQANAAAKAKDATGGVVIDEFLKDPAWVKQQLELYDGTFGGNGGANAATPDALPGGGVAYNPPEPVVPGAATMPPLKSPAEEQAMLRDALTRAGNDTAKKNAILERARLRGVKF